MALALSTSLRSSVPTLCSWLPSVLPSSPSRAVIRSKLERAKKPSEVLSKLSYSVKSAEFQFDYILSDVQQLMTLTKEVRLCTRVCVCVCVLIAVCPNVIDFLCLLTSAHAH